MTKTRGRFSEMLARVFLVILLTALGCLLLAFLFGLGGKILQGGASVQSTLSDKVTLFGETVDTADFEDLSVNETEVLSVMSAYYLAKTDRDEEACESLAPQTEAQELFDYMDSNGITGYQNVTTWSKSGLSAGSYFVYTAYEVLLDGIDTPLPSLAWAYLGTDGDGSLFLEDISSDSSAQGYVQLARESEDAKTLIAFVQTAYESALDEDETLKEKLAASAA